MSGIFFLFLSLWQPVLFFFLKVYLATSMLCMIQRYCGVAVGMGFWTVNFYRSFACYVTASMLEDINKIFLSSFFSFTTMAAKSLSFDSLRIDCKPSIDGHDCAIHVISTIISTAAVVVVVVVVVVGSWTYFLKCKLFAGHHPTAPV